jgi:hypothetical protein
MTIERLDTSINELGAMIGDLTHTVYRLGAILSVQLPEHADNMGDSVAATPHSSSLLDMQAGVIDSQIGRLHSTHQAACALLETLLHGGPDVSAETPVSRSGTTLRHHLTEDTRAYLQRSYPAQGDVDGPI